MIGAKKIRENNEENFWKVFYLPIWLVSRTGFCECGSIVDVLIFEGRANNVAGLPDDRFNFLLLSKVRNP